MGLVAFTFGGAPLYFYGTAVAFGLIVAMLITWWSTWMYDEPFPYAFDIFLWGIPLGILMSRLLYCALHYERYVAAPLSVLRFWEGGFSFYGAAIGLFVALMIVGSREDFSILRWLDVLAPAVTFMIALYAFLGFILQIVVGNPVLMPSVDDPSLAEYVEYGYRPPGFEGYEYFQPIALYQTILMCAVFLLTIMLTVPESHGTMFENGGVFFLSVAAAALVRFGCGRFYLSTASGLHRGEIMAAVIALICVAMFLKHGRRRRRGLWK